MSKTQLFLGLRLENGQIGYLSESLAIPEFFDLIRPRAENKAYLVDFSPVIEALHTQHSRQVELSIREKYNSVFNYWQESKSYSNIQIKLPKFESLSLLSNELITSLQIRLEASKGSYGHRRTSKPEDNIKAVKEIEKDSNIYIDILLCFIHAKASLEIESFKNDVVLHRYCEFLKNIVSDLFNRVVEYSMWQENFKLDTSSLLYHIAFNDNENLIYYTQLLPSLDTSKDLRLSLISSSHAENYHNHNNEPSIEIKLNYRDPHNQELEAAKILRDLLHKINSISGLISKLKEGGVEWNPSEYDVEDLKQLVSKKLPCKN